MVEGMCWDGDNEWKYRCTKNNVMINMTSVQIDYGDGTGSEVKENGGGVTRFNRTITTTGPRNLST